MKRALKSTLRRLVFDGRYYDALEQAAQQPLRSYTTKLQLVTADPLGRQYPLPDDQFDVIVSNAVMEHVGDIGEFAKEVARLLAPGGYFYALIHNFY